MLCTINQFQEEKHRLIYAELYWLSINHYEVFELGQICQISQSVSNCFGMYQLLWHFDSKELSRITHKELIIWHKSISTKTMNYSTRNK